MKLLTMFCLSFLTDKITNGNISDFEGCDVDQNGVRQVFRSHRKEQKMTFLRKDMGGVLSSNGTVCVQNIATYQTDMVSAKLMTGVIRAKQRVAHYPCVNIYVIDSIIATGNQNY